MVTEEPIISNEELLEKEGWTLGEDTVFAYGQEFPITDPINIHLKVYRTHKDPNTRFTAMKRCFEILWPDKVITWNYWMERMFKAHCGVGSPQSHYQTISFAGGAGLGKTFVAGLIVAIFFLSNPQKNAVIVASTTLSSLKSRIYGYVRRALKEAKINYAWTEERTPPPKIHPSRIDDIHGIFAVSANRGDDEESIKNWVGRHPEGSLLLILDEATDLPTAIISATANLEQGLKGTYQIIVIGNSNDIYDLHGAMSTPLIGWDKIDPKVDFQWETTQPRGVCLYFNPYESPAIHETDPIKKAALSNFLMTEEKMIKAERDHGTDSDEFWRFIMGFWRTKDTQTTVVSEAFLRDYDCTREAEFSGRVKLVVCAGLDPAFSAGGDKCLLRLGILGHHVNGKMVLDFKKEALIFPIQIVSTLGKSAELQIADQVIEICGRYAVPLGTLCVDASGQGRGLADVIHLRSGDPRINKWMHLTGTLPPTKIYSTNIGNRNVKSFDVVISSGYELWFTGRKFIENQQIFGMDPLAYGQFHSRQVVTNSAGRKTLEQKAVYKKRMGGMSSVYGRSPDEADSAMLCLQSAILHHGFHPGQMIEAVHFSNEDDRAYHKVMEKIKASNQKAESSMPKATYSKGLNSLLGRRLFH